MSALELRQAFRRRFRAVTRQIWSLHVGRGFARTVLVAAVLAAMFATADYLFELSWLIRAGLMVAGLAILSALTLLWVVRPARAWNRTRVASELEDLFPRLGQRLRTASQHGERSANDLAAEGVAPGLVAALEEETAEKVKPLPFQAALPVRPALVFGVLALASVAALVAASMWAPEWRTAMERVALSATPYTALSATASADTVDEGKDVEISATMSGRARPAVVLRVREAGEENWREETMEAVDGDYRSKLANLRVNTEFFVAAGPERTPTQQIVVRHALKIVEARAEVTSPSYTGVGVATHDSGSFSAVQGSNAKLRFELDRAPTTATLVVKDTLKKTTKTRRIDMAVQDRYVSVELPLTADVEYSVEAQDSQGMRVVANRHRVRVTADLPPSVWFESPGEGMEVHTLAEVMMRVRARDDFGLSKVGIVFQVNNEEEKTLVLQDVNQPNQLEAKAEQLLMLEQFLLTQKDCVAYYAFAEDNRPDSPQRTTTELRFIDIRPFQRIYRLQDPGEPMPGQQRDFIFLDEVIARQRFNLNQTMRLEIRSKVRIDLAEVEKTANFENKLATQTHDLADFLTFTGVDGAAILAQAEEAMLSAVDSLNGAKFTTAINQERDALRYLMEARNTIQQSILKQPRQVRAQAKAFDRIQRQKLRRPNDQVETLAQIAEELGKLANEEDDVARTIVAMGGNMSDPMAKPMPGGNDPTKPMPGGNDPMAKPMPGGNDPTAKPMPGGNDPTAKPMPGGNDPMAEPRNGKGGKDPAQDRQDEIAGRAALIEKVAATAKGLTDLAKTRIGEASKAANAAADALGQGDRPTARKEVDRAKELFRTTAKQVAALAAEEAAQQLAAARDLANDVAMQTAPSDPMKNSGAGSGMDKDKKMPGAGSTPEKNEEKKPGLGNAAEQAKSLKDVLEKLAGSGAEGDADAARKAGAILKQEDLAAAIARLEKPGAEDDRGERQDLADRFAALGQKLDQAYRETVAPRLEEIARLEREANELEKKAAMADDATEWRRLRQQAEGFVEKLEAAGLGGLVSEDVRAGLKNGAANGLETFSRGISATHLRLVAKLQEFLAGDRYASGNEAVPPEYKDLVERYLRTLSAGSSK
jgi:hypothetical protein